MEFTEVMKQWRRMCDMHTCSRNKIAGLLVCPIVCQHSGYPCEEDPIDWTEEATRSFEEIIMAWAAEHPEPVYPTWGEWFVEHGDLVDGWQNATNSAWMANTALSIFMKPIAADIAQKLGIEPKEG